ncbi:YrdB family protein [Microbacterium sp. T32]|uniref:YrdB family protein n=1 Tax=Microbacterium sp. T32 TaxID=1776083 RepID=UPI0007ABA7D4|nr:YrdB family protein [Microbacterium sp. T32]KZE36815.1 4-amino-4-deoxy-L-arabinose transferase [Microbacterium sp. T32]
MTDTPHVSAQAPLAPGMRPRPTAVEIGSVLCGVVAFVTLAIWGFTGWPFPWNIVAGIGAPLLALLVWALFVSPRAVLAVHPFVRAIVELFVYAAATIAWWSMGQAWIGLIFAIVAVTVGALNGRRRLG